ncbi:MAG: SAM-dependent methyltransferase [Phycisphaerales bacterium]
MGVDRECGGDTRELYQRIYETEEWYGNAEINRCPGVRLFPLYRDWLLGPVMDIGCGRGHTVEHLRRSGLEADGIDQIDLANGMLVGDITRPLDLEGRYRSALCIDVIEHIDDEGVLRLFENFKQCERQAFSIHNGESICNGEDLHINRKPFEEWRRIISEHFELVEEVPTSPEQMLYLTSRLG